MSHNYHRQYPAAFSSNSLPQPRDDHHHNSNNDLSRLLDAPGFVPDNFGGYRAPSPSHQGSPRHSHHPLHHYHNARAPPPPPPPPPSYLIPPLTLPSHHGRSLHQQHFMRHANSPNHHHAPHHGHHALHRYAHQQSYRSSPIQRPQRRKCDVEPHVVRECVDILCATHSSSLKSVELANAIRDRLGRDVLQMVKSAVGGLLSLLEEHPSLFDVTRRPKADSVRLQSSATSSIVAVAGFPQEWTNRELVAQSTCDMESIVSANITRANGRRYAVLQLQHNAAALTAYFAFRTAHFEVELQQDASREVDMLTTDFSALRASSPRHGSGLSGASSHRSGAPMILTDMRMLSARSTTSTATSDEQISPASTNFSLFFSGGGSDWTSLSASSSASSGLTNTITSVTSSTSTSSIIQRQMSESTTSTESSPRMSVTSGAHMYVLDMLCDQQFVPHSLWPADYDRDKPILDILVDVVATAISSVPEESATDATSIVNTDTCIMPGTMLISNLKTKLKKRLESYGHAQVSIRQPPLKALLSAYPTMFAVDNQNKSVGLHPTVAIAHYFQQRAPSSFGGL